MFQKVTGKFPLPGMEEAMVVKNWLLGYIYVE
jgi:hypothetical protein